MHVVDVWKLLSVKCVCVCVCVCVYVCVCVCCDRTSRCQNEIEGPSFEALTMSAPCTRNSVLAWKLIVDCT